MGRTNGNSQRVAAAFGSKAQRVLRLGINGFGDGFFGGAVGTDMTDLCFQ